MSKNIKLIKIAKKKNIKNNNCKSQVMKCKIRFLNFIKKITKGTIQSTYLHDKDKTNGIKPLKNLKKCSVLK